ncbi:hypothetical protein ROZALSC1DRAFT_27811, partial [Rozella allomycis CSF55]
NQTAPCPLNLDLRNLLGSSADKNFKSLFIHQFSGETLGFSLDPKYRKFFAQIIASFKPSFKDLCLELLKKST